MNRNNWKRLLSLALSAILSTGSCLAASHWAADPALNHVSAAAPPLVGFTSDTLSGDQTITGAQNMGELRNNGKVRYWFGNNAFYGMKRGTPPQGENYDPGSWFLVDTDAIWEDQYMYTRFAVTAPSDGQVNSYMNIHQNSDDYSITADRGHYYQKILTFGVKLWDEIRGGFSEAEKSAMRPAEVTTSAEYRSFEHPFYSFMPRALAATSSENLKDYKIDSAKMIEALEDVSNAETYYGIPYKYADGNGAVDRSNYMRIKDTNTDRLTLENAVCLGASEEKNYQPYDTRSKYSDSVIDVRPSNIYSVTDALLYAPSNLEFEQNKSVGKAIYQNLISVTETLNNSELMGKNIRSKIWTRSFAGVKPDFNHTFVGYSIGENGVVNLKNQIAEPAAFTPALNLDTRRVIMAREKSVDDRQANSGPNLEVVDSSYLDADSVDVGFLLKSDSLHLDSDINGKQLTNVICGGTYQIKYENASASADESSTNNGPLYVAGAIYDDENTMKYYGLLGTVNNDGSGTVSITIPQNLDPSKQYKLAVFEEQRGAAFEQNYPAGRTITAYPTDYASAMNVAAFRPAGITAGIKEKAMLLEDTTYSKADISTMIDVVGNNSGALSATEYRILSKQAYEALPNKTRDEILNADTLDTITTENASATARSQEIVVLYFPTDDQVFSAELSFPVLPQTGAEYSDANSKEWHEIEKNGTTWHYQLNPQGKITALYTKDPVDDLVDDNLVLALPSKLDGLPVIGIGSGESGKPVIPADTDDIFSEIALPANLTSINDYAFFGLKNPAFSVRIPESLEHLGCKAFAKSGIKALRAANLAGDISFRAFAETNKLKHVSIQAAENGISIGKEAFDNAAISTLQLAGTMHLSEHAFRNNTALESVTIPYGGEAEAGTFQG
ncbi:MAG: leucine-rich repeat domain-containing protein, partial [Lachnospiraceae bacterium]|nr:leucine-rich repeat domain-containing protein [Lachnospiraceae bacterium]